MEELFWADQIAELILNRKRYNYIDKKLDLPKQLVVKSSTSISGVPHIGNASDIIRHDAVVKALKERKADVKFIWVAEDMDPLRKVPAGIPKEFSKYLGMPVADIPCPDSCCKNYTHHFCTKFIDSLRNNFGTNPEFLSTADEYRKGFFSKWVKIIFDNLDEVRKILNKSRKEPLPKDWNPWKPVCKNCGKIITTKVIGLDKGIVKYSCEDYQFKPFGEKAYTKLKGCGFKGESDMKNGKLLWRVEWGMLWAAWKVVFEAAGKEHFMPGGSFWSAGKVCEKIFNWPEPYPGENSLQPYEYLTIAGKKMSASKGNVVATWDWPTFTLPQILRLIFLKRPNKVRDFSYKDIPKYVDEFDDLQKIFFGKEKVENEKDLYNMKRLYEMSEIKIPKKMPIQIPFDFAALITQIVPKERMLEKSIQLLKTTGHITGDLSEIDKKMINYRLGLAKIWAERYGGEEYKIKVLDKPSKQILDKLDEKQKKALKLLSGFLVKDVTEKELYMKFFEIAKEIDIDNKKLFEAAYLVLLGRNFGPRLAPFILTIGKKEVSEKFNI